MNKPTTRAILAPGKIYHVYTRGNNRETLFKDKENYPYFLRLWFKHIRPVADTYAFCLLSNHFHFAIRVKEIEELPEKYATGARHLSKPFGNCFNAYTKAINKRYQRTGSLFEETYNRKEVGSETYFQRLIAYIHANPQHHRFCEDFRDYLHSSFFELASDFETELLRDELWDSFGGREGFISFHADYQRRRCWNQDDFDMEGEGIGRH
jgi:REP element-mobilizing transposase RayT